jgi:hypothetical protein
MVRRFDEIILHKASKLDLVELDGRKVEKYQITKMEKDIEKKVKEMITE